MKRIVIITLLFATASLWAQSPQIQDRGVLPEGLSASSSLFFFNGRLWSANDHGRVTLYAIDTIGASIIDSLPSVSPDVVDLEAVAQDEEYLYLADVGNNAGSRRDLHILRYDKGLVMESADRVVPDTIWLSYPDQVSFESDAQNTDFDCEAVVATDTALLLFSKQWVSHRSVVYSVPKVPGRYVASAVAEIAVDGLVTDASLHVGTRRLVLCGYSSFLQPFVFVIDDFGTENLQACPMRKYSLDGVIAQTEGIATLDGEHYYVSSEAFSILGLSDSARLRMVCIPQASTSSVVMPQTQPAFRVYPNPSSQTLNVDGVADGSIVYLLDVDGRIVMTADAEGGRCVFTLSGLLSGTYIVSDGSRSVSFIHTK